MSVAAEKVVGARRFRPYPEYKDAGVEWLGRLPAHWNATPIRGLARLGYKTFTDGDWVESPYIRDEGIRLIQTGNIGTGFYKEQGHRYIDEDTFNAFRCTEFAPGDVLICRLAAPVGRACLAPDLAVRMITSVDVCILKARSDVNPRFIVYALSQDAYLSWMSALCRGGTRDRISRSMLGAIRIPTPAFVEQRAIADFLDRETAKIDALIARKQRLIELLQEKRTAFITHAVTKGLDPTVPMKDSGIEWLGEIPAHWEAGALRRWWDVIDCKHRTVPFVDDGVPVASIGEVRGLEVDLSTATRTTESEYRLMIEGGRDPLPGDIIYSRNATVGEAALVTGCEPFCMGQDVALLRSRDQDQRFLVFLLRSPAIIGQLELLMVGSTFKRINVGQIKQFSVCRPPINEQLEIAEYAVSSHKRIQRLVDRLQEGVERILEFRTALISAAVTGKIDVREEVT